jgi:hypothetical protein
VHSQTDAHIQGTLESLGRALCPFTHLRELDLDGSYLTGTRARARVVLA